MNDISVGKRHKIRKFINVNDQDEHGEICIKNKKIKL